MPNSWRQNVALQLVLALLIAQQVASGAEIVRRLYVATPGVRNYLEMGGHGLLVFEIDQGHRWSKRIPLRGFDRDGQPQNIKGICGHAASHRLYVTTLDHVQCVDLITESIVWERTYPGGCDRLAIHPLGDRLYVPSLEKDHWHVVDSSTGDIVARVEPHEGAHNTIAGPAGQYVYLAGLRSPYLAMLDTRTNQVVRRVGPFSHSIRPFTIRGDESNCFVTINELLGFEIGDLRSGAKQHRITVDGYPPGPVKRHGCPSHGIGMTPDEREIWVTDGHHRQLHVFDATADPPAIAAHIALRDEPGWIVFSRDGRFAYPSTGEIIDVAQRRIVGQLRDEESRAVQSEKMLEVHWEGAQPAWVGSQFGIGQAKLQPR